jgi:hypothetical protein
VTRDVDIELVVRIVLRVLQELERSGSDPFLSRSVTPSAVGSRQVVTEHDVVAAIAAGRIALAPGAIVTPLARDTAREKGVELVVA